MRRILTSLLFILCSLLFSVSANAQSDDIELTDSTSTDWGGGTGGGGIDPQEPNDPVTSLTLSQTSLTLEGGERVRLVATVNQQARNKNIIWSSANSNVASVDATGTVMGLAKGQTVITATAEGNTSLKKTCTVTVTSDYVPPVSGWILPWGRDEAWTMKYQQDEYTMEPGNTDWTKPSFNDNRWLELTGPMGDEGEYNYYWEGDENCYKLRREFIMPTVDPYAIYTFYAIHDDDLWIYLNGELVGYFNDWSAWEERPLNIPANMFVKGRNVLALRIIEHGGGQYLDYALYREAPLKGDVNGDGKVDIGDVILVIKTIAGDTNQKADVDGNGRVDFHDVLFIFSLL
jgi:hypothetical protein